MHRSSKNIFLSAGSEWAFSQRLQNFARWTNTSANQDGFTRRKSCSFPITSTTIWTMTVKTFFASFPCFCSNCVVAGLKSFDPNIPPPHLHAVYSLCARRVKALLSLVCTCCIMLWVFKDAICIHFHLMPNRKDGDDKARPVIIHRAILGSVERMIAILTENYAGKWWDAFCLFPR